MSGNFKRRWPFALRARDALTTAQVGYPAFVMALLLRTTSFCLFFLAAVHVHAAATITVMTDPAEVTEHETPVGIYSEFQTEGYVVGGIVESTAGATVAAGSETSGENALLWIRYANGDRKRVEISTELSEVRMMAIRRNPDTGTIYAVGRGVLPFEEQVFGNDEGGIYMEIDPITPENSLVRVDRFSRSAFEIGLAYNNVSENGEPVGVVLGIFPYMAGSQIGNNSDSGEVFGILADGSSGIWRSRCTRESYSSTTWALDQRNS